MYKAPLPSKLRRNDSEQRRNLLQSCSNLGVEETNSIKSYSFNTGELIAGQNYSMPRPTSKLPQIKCGGRGMIMKQLFEESKNNMCGIIMKKSSNSMDYSNGVIELHFKKLQEETKKKQNEKKKMDWKMKFDSNQDN